MMPPFSTRTWPLVSTIFSRISSPKPFITLSTMMSTATPSITPTMEASVKNAMRRPLGNSCFSAR